MRSQTGHKPRLGKMGQGPKEGRTQVTHRGGNAVTQRSQTQGLRELKGRQEVTNRSQTQRLRKGRGRYEVTNRSQTKPCEYGQGGE